MTISVRNAFGFALVNPNPFTGAEPPTDYRKDQKLLIYDLIEKSNPGFKAKFPLGSLKFLSVTAIAVSNTDQYKNDTSVIVSSNDAAVGTGSVVFKYRRIDIGKLFGTTGLKLDTWVSGTQLAFTAWAPLLAAKYGVNWLNSDWNIGTGLLDTGTQYNFAMVPSCLCYRGTVGIQWTKGKQGITNLIPTGALAGRTYPTDNLWVKPKGELFFYGLDFSPIKTTGMNAFTSPQTIPTNYAGSNSIVNAITNFLKANTPYNDWSDLSINTLHGLTGTTWTRLTLPNALAPEANSTDFTACVLITGGASSWFTGRLLMHYNI